MRYARREALPRAQQRVARKEGPPVSRKGVMAAGGGNACRQPSAAS
jgi:hypothetical protein